MTASMTTMGAAADAVRLFQMHSPSLHGKSRPCCIATPNIRSVSIRNLQNVFRFPRAASISSSVNVPQRRRGRRPGDLDLPTFYTGGSHSGLPVGFCSKERLNVGFPFPSTQQQLSCSRVVVAQGKKNNTVEAPERVLAALGYILPLFDGIQYGRYFFLQYPAAEVALRPLYPLLSAYKSFPYSNFIAFFALYLLVVRNDGISRYVRFNAMQAVVLDVLLILPTLVERTFAPRGGVGFDLLIIFYNTVFLFLVACFVFGVVSCILGRTPRLPIVADAADAQV